MHPIRLLVLLLLLPACAPCAYDNGIVSGAVTEAPDGDPAEGGHIEITPDGTGTVIEANIFGDGLYEASVPAGDYDVVAWNSDATCFSAITTVTVAPCDELTVDLTIIDCF